MKKNHLLIALALMVGLLLAGCSARAAVAPSIPASAQIGELIDFEACEFRPANSKASYSAECGTLVVAENWQSANSRPIGLPVVRIPASQPDPAEPVFWLTGGPGQSNLAWAPPDWLLQSHDVVMVGYRGVEGTVVLSCPEADGLFAAHMGRDLISDQMRETGVAAVQKCTEQFRASGADFSGYSIVGVVEDLEATRVALGYERINLLSESYGTRVAQIYAYMHPDSLNRLVLVGVNTPGRFIWRPSDNDRLIRHISELCAKDAACSSRTDDLAEAMFAVNHNMPERWLFFKIDPGTVRFGTQMLFFFNPQMPMVFDAYLSAAEGDPSGLAMLNLIARMTPTGDAVFGEQLIKAASADLETYDGPTSISLGDSIMGAPLSEMLWPIAAEMPVELIPQELRELQETEVEMLLVNGTVDFSTPPFALDEARPYFHNAQMVLLPEFSHTQDVFTLQPAALERLITTYYDTGVGDASLFAYQPLSFEPGISLAVIARLIVGAMIVLPALIIGGVALTVRRMRQRRSPEMDFRVFLKRHSLVIGIILMFLYTWTIDLSNSGVLPFQVPLGVALTVGWGFIFVSLLMTWLTLGRDEMVMLFKRFFLWRVDWKWYLVAVLLIPAIRFAAIPLTAWLTGIPADYSHPMVRDIVPLDWPLLAMVIPWLLFEVFTNGEEMGWRGYVLPRLQDKHNALVSSLILGVIWSVWHLPKFIGTGLNQERSFFWFSVVTLSLAILYTWLYNSTRGSLLLVTLFHASSNTVGLFLPVKFAVVGGLFSNLETVLLAIAAIVVTSVSGAERLSRMERKQIQNMNNQLLFKSMLVILTLGALLSIAIPAIAQENRITPGTILRAAPSQRQGPTDPTELETFLDGLLGKQMEEYHIAGAAISVVKDGELFFAKGYGYADLENGIPVDPERTVFRIGSVTKLVTWTAVMQLAEQGKLDLDADVNTYLDFRIPDTYPQPITLRHLLTHTAGFEDLYVDFVTSESEDQLPSGAFLASHIPARVRPPGDLAAYSNYGAALGGYIVARVSGQSYDQYIQEHILDPLGMAHSTALATLHPDVAAQESVGYLYEDGSFQIFPKLYGPPDLAPMGFMGASATDMGRFMIAHLQNGRYSDADIPETRILGESTARQMHSTLFTHDPRLLGTAYGFFDFSDNGQRTIGHSGEAEPMHSLLLILPDQNLGVFVAYNTLGAGPATVQHLGFQRAFFDQYYPAPAIDPIQPPADFAARAGRFVGSYRMAQSAYTTLEKFMGFSGAFNVVVSDPGDGTLTLTTPYGEWRFVEVGPLYFRQVDAPFHVVFREDSRGHITRLFADYIPQFGFEKLSWYETPGFNIPLLLGCVLVFLSAILIALIRAIRNRLSGEGKPAPRGAQLAEWIILGICALNLLFVVGSFMWNNPRPSRGVSLNFQIVLGLGVLSAVLTVGALVYMALAWKNRYWGIAGRAYYTLVTVAAVAFVWFLNQWNLLGWRY